MSRPVSLAILGLKVFTAFWALITFAVAASLQSKFYFNDSATAAVIAGGVLTMLWILVSLILQFVLPETVIISVMVDVILFSILFVLTLGGAAASSENASFYRRYSRFSEAKLGSAVIGLSWILVILLLAILIFQFYYTLRNFGTAKQTWLTPFHHLVSGGGVRNARSAADIEIGQAPHTAHHVSGHTAGTTQMTQPPSHAGPGAI